MIQINDPKQCCGCSACANICPHRAITMQPDALGFLYPIIDKEKCIDCGVCEKVCSFNDHYDISNNLTHPVAFGARHHDIREVETSRSGAAFIAISDWVLSQGGVVYGASFSNHFHVIHKRATTPTERNEFKGSKYVQSELGDIFQQVKADLKKGLIVLFSGTPCQTAGLNSYIGNKLRTNLYLIDIVCHGVPSPKIWEDYLSFLEKKENDSISCVNFRDKEHCGWKAHTESFRFTKQNDKTVIVSLYTHLFYQHIMFRQSCSICHFSNIQRPSDITIADFWGWEKTAPEINKDDKGVSLILCNTNKGLSVIDNIKKDMYIIPIQAGNYMQPNLIHPTRMHPLRNRFERDYKKYGFTHTLKKYGFLGGWQEKRFKIISFLLRSIRKAYSIFYH